jgi:two-component system, cell cycle response regulator DivK
MAKKILIVEDNISNSVLFQDILTFHGYQVSLARDGQEALTMAREMMPELILMDIQMPGMDGKTAGIILKEDPATSGIKIIALTAFAMPRDRKEFLAAGFDAYLSKPIGITDLLSAVQSCLGEEHQP